jgi:hypothetical protein
VKAEQDGPIGIQDLTKVVMARRRLGLAEEDVFFFIGGSGAEQAEICQTRARKIHHSLNSPACSCVSATLPAAS